MVHLDTERAHTDPLLAACRLVGDALGLVISVPVPSASERVQVKRDRLDEIARASRLRMRRVALRGAWWRQDNGPLLAFAGHEKQPVALLPLGMGHRGYRLIVPAVSSANGSTPDTQQLTPTLAATLEPFAYTFFRSFPARAIGLLDLLRFGLRGSGSDFIMMLVMGALAGGLGLLPALVTGALFDTVIPTANRAMLAQLALALVTAALATALFQLVRSFAVLRLEQRISTATQAAVWDRLLNLPAPFFDAFSVGDLTARVSGIDQIRQTLTGVTLTTVLTGAFSLFNLGLLFVYDWRLAGLALALLLIAVVITLVCGRRALRYTRPLNLMQSKLAGLVLQLVGGIARLRVAGAERRAFAVWAERFAELRRLSFMAGNADNFLAVFNAAFPSLALATLFAWAAFQVGVPSRTTGAMLAFVSAFSSLLIATLSASENILAILRIVPLYENARPILATLPEVSAAKVHPGILSGAIAVNHVTFRYRPDGLVVLNDVSFEAKPGEFVAIVGPSGSGKSTLLRLLLGFGAPELGAICYDDQDLGALDLQELRRQIGVVLQNTRLLPGDIFSNIVGTSLLTLDDAWAAARLAGLEDNIRQMPMGMHTVIGAGASTFSGGQRQRLAIARAVASRPRILFFDEATSALDNRTQAIVSQSLEVLQATRIVIAHRLSTIAHADRIYVMMAGRVAQCGCYAELIEQDGPFRELARRQVLTTL